MGYSWDEIYLLLTVIFCAILGASVFAKSGEEYHDFMQEKIPLPVLFDKWVLRISIGLGILLLLAIAINATPSTTLPFAAFSSTVACVLMANRFAPRLLLSVAGAALAVVCAAYVFEVLVLIVDMISSVSQ